MSQIFKEKIKMSILFDFLQEFCVKKDSCYIFENVSFKKAQYNKKIIPFLEKIKKYYYKSKLSYITRKMNYKNFTTIIRQICKNNLIPFTSKIFYFNSTYEIKYYIYPKHL
jgi:transposase